ncbi:transposase [Sporomusa acidovorans]|uniref:Transposase n=1 Tax=Sporomusa acidovorans (strain ATCC 49682 / DSM 3132 / Mol) TaxID=1123286 RepID=A0ABZ3J6E4_SPOA4|nr:transposase [Sporomusa acidovorans]OZC23798.1 hypothetical protein SPACI_04230 [Sporomusa acidovorans DSM 3132]SDF61511.1 hypothetical protein SAMN04488499_10633 [Sporomusa acidovorans]
MAKYEQWLTAEGLLQLEAWARDGLTNEQIASNMGISRETLNQWKHKHPDISDALKKGKEVVDIQVENALLKRALGYEFTEVTKERVYNDTTKKFEFKVTKKVVKEVQPDTTAQIFWLKNRKPADWRDKKDVELSGQVKNNFSDLTDEEIEQRIKKLKTKLGIDASD